MSIIYTGGTSYFVEQFTHDGEVTYDYKTIAEARINHKEKWLEHLKSFTTSRMIETGNLLGSNELTFHSEKRKPDGITWKFRLVGTGRKIPSHLVEYIDDGYRIRIKPEQSDSSWLDRFIKWIVEQILKCIRGNR